MKKYIHIVLMLLVFSSCSDYLEQDAGELNTIDKIFASEVETKKWYSRMYSDDFMVQEMHYSGQIPYFWCTDEAAYVMESNIRNISEGLMSPDNYYGYTGYNLYFFVRYYQAIRHINIFLENLDRCVEMGELERRTKYAEAIFMRAYYHYLLLRLYGPIPIEESSRTADGIAASSARKPFAECVQWISEQIDWACENGMPEERNESIELGLPTVGAARAIQSRMHLLAASPLYNGNSVYKDWKNNDGTVLIPTEYDKELWKVAADAAKDVIDNYGYELKKPDAESGEPTFDEVVENIREITTTWGEDKNREIIWGHPNSIQWYARCAVPGRWYGWNGRYSLPLGMINDFFMADGSKARPLEEWFENKEFSTEDGNGTIANTFHMFVDREPRFYAWVAFQNGYYEVLRRDGADDNANIVQTRFRKNDVFGIKERTTNYTPTGYLNKKGCSPLYNNIQEDVAAPHYPWPVIRMAELYLNLAEAYANLGRIDEAVAALKPVRERAGLDPVDEAFEKAGLTLGRDEMIRMARQERTIELYLEGHRFWDVRRWKEGDKYFNVRPKGMNYNGESDADFFRVTEVIVQRKFMTPMHYLMPIPKDDINKNERKFVQNPGY